MNPVIPAAAVHAALKARIEKERAWTSMESGMARNTETQAHMQGRAWAFGKVLGWLKTEGK